jgi:hypothetical protein
MEQGSDGTKGTAAEGSAMKAKVQNRTIPARHGS